jgi:hypothetical protein
MSTDQELKEGQELVKSPEAAIDLFEAFSDPLTELEEKNTKVKFDITTYEGETECKKYIAKVGKFRIGVEKLRVSLKREFLDKGKAVDKKAKVYQARIAEIDAVHSVPLKELENKRIAEALEAREAEQAALKAIEDKRVADLEAREAKMAAKEAEQQIKDDAAQAERDAADRKEELEAAALLAAENVKIQAEQDAIDAAAKAEQDKRDAVAEVERKAKADAAILAKEIADKYEAEQAEQRKIDAGILAKAANVEHQKDFNNTAVFAIESILLNSEPTTGSKELSIAIVTAIAKRQIPNVTINY